jgi:hypothetical protein
VSPTKTWVFGMELFLNLCWLSLLLPGYLLWRQRSFSIAARERSGSSIDSATSSPLTFLCILGCALVLLFPVISASDDLHAMRPEMEESERAFRHANHCASTSGAVTHASQPVLASFASETPDFAQIGMVQVFLPQVHGIFFTPAPAGRAPPLALAATL